MRYTVRPLTIESKTRLKGVRREGSPFSAHWSDTIDLLNREIGYLGAREYVIEIDITESDLKLNGELRSTARPASPAVAVSFEPRGKPSLLFVCGKFPHWQHNVRAIALGLEALRKVDRYGITQAQEQYRGFGALPPGTPMPAVKMTVDEARRLLVEHGGYRNAIKTHHPDMGGDAGLFRQLTEARDLIAGTGEEPG